MSNSPPTGAEPAGALDRAAKVLCIRLDNLGDVLMTTPALRAIKESGAGRGITLLASPSGAKAGRLLPLVDQVIVYEAPWMKATAPRADAEPDLGLIDRLRAERFDAAVIFTVYSQSPLPAALLCFLAGIPMRLAHCRENPYQLLTHWLPEIEPERLLRHEVQRQLDLVASVGCRTRDARLSLRVSDSVYNRIVARLRAIALDYRRPWVVIHPGASAPSRRYPPEQFAEVARCLAREHGMQVLFTGSASESALIHQIRLLAGTRSASLAGELDLEELAALIAMAPVLVANNTGPVHVAAAVGTPVVDLYALTNPQHTPWAVPHRVLNHDVPCKHCYKSICPQGHHDCLRLVSPRQVVSAVRELLAETGRLPDRSRISPSMALACLPAPAV